MATTDDSADNVEEFDVDNYPLDSSMPEFSDRNINPFPMDNDYVPAVILASESGQIADFNDMKSVNLEIDKLRIALFKTNDHIRDAERKFIEAKTAYERAFQRAYVATTAKTADLRKNVAKIKTEPLENKVITRKLVLDELCRRSRAMSTELEALKTLSYNMRKEMDTAK